MLLRGNIGKPRRRPVPGARPLQRAGRPHHGHLGEGARRPARRAARRVRLRAAASTASTPSTTIRGHARRPGQGVLRGGRQLRRGHPRHGGDRGRDAQPRPDRARLDQAQPVARGHRRGGADPALPGPHRARPPGRRRAVRHASRTRWAWCTPRGGASTRPRRTCGPRWRSSPGWPRRSSARRHGRLGRDAPRLRQDPRPHRAGDPGLRAVQRARAQAGRLRAAAPAPRPPRVHDQDRQGQVHRQRARRGRSRRPATCCCRRCAATTSSTPPSTASTTATAGSSRGDAWCSSTPRTCARSASHDGELVDLVSVWADGQHRRSGGPRSSGSSSYATARGCAAAYFPETNVLVPLDSVAKVSNTPVSKSIVVRLEHRDRRSTASSLR